MDKGFLRPEDVTVKNMAELERIFANRRKNIQGTIVERRDYRDGLLQLETRHYAPIGNARGPCWYYHYRQDGRQRTLYVGKTDEPESVVDTKLPPTPGPTP